eukprot:GFYU01039993.1.p1 GENE.GFYU01039993.1~~GFYU01039993.1.p1  ORF type:complete len:197 (+),score=15.97 GFYU01039993.1:3-593(+)
MSSGSMPTTMPMSSGSMPMSTASTSATTSSTTTETTSTYTLPPGTEVAFSVSGSATTDTIRTEVASVLDVPVDQVTLVSDNIDAAGARTVVLGFSSQSAAGFAISKANDNAFAAVGVTGAAAVVPPSPSPGDDGISTTTIIIIAVCAGGGVLLIILVVVACAVKARRRGGVPFEELFQDDQDAPIPMNEKHPYDTY